MDVLSDKVVTIRKPHKCFACGRLFKVGTPMRSQVHTYDGIQNVYSCSTCDVLMNEFSQYFIDDIERIYPEYCVSELYYDFKVSSPEELLLAMRGGSKMTLSATLFLLAVIAYSIKDLQSFHKLKWMDRGKPFSFWGKDSHVRKYKDFSREKGEAFFLSTTLLVAFTDGFHLMQALAKIFICAAFYPLTNWWFPVVMWCLWGICFTLCDKYLTK